MGAGSSCPAGFDPGFMICTAKCPSDFIYTRDVGPPPVEKCAHRQNTSLAFPLKQLPMVAPGQPTDNQYAQELERINREADAIRSRAQASGGASSGMSGDTMKIKEISDSLKPFRPPTQPSSDIEQERQSILRITQHKLLLIQIVLFLIVLSMLSYLFLSFELANGITFLLLCVGVALGFFLRK